MLIRGRAFCGEDARRKRTGRPRKISNKSFPQPFALWDGEAHGKIHNGLRSRDPRATSPCGLDAQRLVSRSRARQCRRARSCRIGADVSASIRAYLRASIGIACRRAGRFRQRADGRAQGYRRGTCALSRRRCCRSSQQARTGVSGARSRSHAGPISVPIFNEPQS